MEQFQCFSKKKISKHCNCWNHLIWSFNSHTTFSKVLIHCLCAFILRNFLFSSSPLHVFNFCLQSFLPTPVFLAHQLHLNYSIYPLLVCVRAPSRPINLNVSQTVGPEQAALAQSQHFEDLEALWNKKSPPRRRQMVKQNSLISQRESSDGGLSDEKE